MLRLYCIQLWFGLSDEGVEDALYDSAAFRRFVGIDLRTERAPDSTTLLKFRRLLETHDLTRALLDGVNAGMQERRLLLKRGTLIDATIIAAPSSTKNAQGTRDPEMRSTKKGNNWHFGLKLHIGVDAESGLAHTGVTTAAHAADVSHVTELLHGEEADVFADAGYTGVDKRDEVTAAQQDGRIAPNVNWHVATKRSLIKKRPDGLGNPSSTF